MTRYKVECTGCPYTAAMRMNKTSHIISTPEACRKPSDKLRAALGWVACSTIACALPTCLCSLADTFLSQMLVYQGWSCAPQ
jgi:hypothetical protein